MTDVIDKSTSQHDAKLRRPILLYRGVFYPVGFHDSILHNQNLQELEASGMNQMADTIVILDLNVAGQIITCRLLILVGSKRDSHEFMAYKRMFIPNRAA